MKKTLTLITFDSLISQSPEDLLHCLHQGVACVLIASLVCDHLENKHPELTLKRMDELLSKHVYKHYRNWCKRYGKNVSACCHRFSCQRFGKDTWGTPAELNSVYKAAVVKSMMYWAAAFLKEEDNGVPGGSLRISTMHAFAKFQHLIDTNGPFFTPEVSSQVVCTVRKGLLLYQKIAGQDQQRTDERKNYKIIPKFHSLFEMSFYIEQTHRNPRSLNHINIFLFGFWAHEFWWVF